MKRQYYWPGMRKDILRHCKRCHQCALQNQGTGEVGFDHFKRPISSDGIHLYGTLWVLFPHKLLKETDTC